MFTQYYIEIYVMNILCTFLLIINSLKNWNNNKNIYLIIKTEFKRIINVFPGIIYVLVKDIIKTLHPRSQIKYVLCCLHSCDRKMLYNLTSRPGEMDKVGKCRRHKSSSRVRNSATTNIITTTPLPLPSSLRAPLLWFILLMLMLDVLKP